MTQAAKNRNDLLRANASAGDEQHLAAKAGELTQIDMAALSRSRRQREYDQIGFKPRLDNKQTANLAQHHVPQEDPLVPH